MAAPSGIAGQIAYGEESAYGTAVTPDIFLPFISESLERTQNRGTAAGTRPGRLTVDRDDRADFEQRVTGSVQQELYGMGSGIRTILKHALGAESGVGPYTFTPGLLTGLGLTIEAGVPQTDGTVRTKTAAGCKINSAEIAVTAGEFATLGLDVIGQTLDVTTGAVTSSTIPADTVPFTFIDGSATILGSTYNVRSATVSVENALDTDRLHLGESNIAEPLDNDRRTYGGEVEVEFGSLALFDAFRDRTLGDIVLTLDNGTEDLAITMSVELESGTPMVADRGLVVVSYPFTCVADGSDADGLTMVLTQA